MTTYKLIENNNPILSIPLSGCSEGLNRQEVKDNLVETMKGSAGVGLSANQCGVMERVFVMYSDIKKKEILSNIIEWKEILSQSKLVANQESVIILNLNSPITHIRFNIFPDGGVSRLRILGRSVL